MIYEIKLMDEGSTSCVATETSALEDIFIQYEINSIS